MPPVCAVTCAAIPSWGSRFPSPSLCVWHQFHQWPVCSSAAITLDHSSPMSDIFLSVVHQIYKPNCLKFHISESYSKEGRLTHPLSGFLFKPRYHRVKSRHFSSCSPACAFSAPSQLLLSSLHTDVLITLAKRTNFPETTASLFSSADTHLVIWLINGTCGN